MNRKLAWIGFAVIAINVGACVLAGCGGPQPEQPPKAATEGGNSKPLSDIGGGGPTATGGSGGGEKTGAPATGK